MLDLNELEMLTAFAELGTLSKVSEQFHISNPSITRVMKHLEESFGVSLFNRTKNRIELNDTGLIAVSCVKNILSEVDHAIREVRDYDKSLRTITVSSCAPAPLWKLLPMLTAAHPAMTISSSICDAEEVVATLTGGTCDIGILPCAALDASIRTKPFMQEHLSICVKKDHELAGQAEVSFADINGFNFLLRSELGFWDSLCRAKMPSSKFLVQDNEFEFMEILGASSLPCFVTDVTTKQNQLPEGRISIPISDEEAKVTFYLASRGADRFIGVF